MRFPTMRYVPPAKAQTGFALPIAIVAKCEEIINLAQKILIWRQLLAKEKSQVNFFCLASESSPPATSHCLVPLI